MKSTRLVLATAVFCLLISGAAGLVYEIVWMRYLALFLGNTAYGVIVALAAFMGGLALGNAWIGRYADRIRRSLALYAWLEIGIGAYALVFPWYYDQCHMIFVGIAQGWTPGSQSLLALKFVFSLLTILAPTVLMGGTLPVLIKLVTRSLGELRERVSTLYFINSVGAVIGCFIADFWWIPSMGMPATVWGGATLNLIAGALALFVSGWIHEEQAGVKQAQHEPERESSDEGFNAGELRLAVIGIGISGFVAMLYEVVWTRMLALALGSSTHAFSIMLITFISGIAVGAWWIGRWRKLRRTLDAFAWAELGLAATLAVTMCFYEFIPFWFVRMSCVLQRRDELFPLYGLIQAMICFLVMFVPTLFLGTTLPLVSRIATAELARTGRSVGLVFSVNTLGTVLGAVVTGLWLMPWLGLAGALALGVALNAVIGLVVLTRNRRRWCAGIVLATPVLAVAAVLLAGALFTDRWQRTFTRGLWRGDPVPNYSVFRNYAGRIKLAYYRDGAGSTVSVEATKNEGAEQLSLSVNGKPDASTYRDVSTQLLLGHIPMLLRPDARRVLVVGLGSGMTCRAVMRHPVVEQLDVVEISPEVAQAGRLFGAHNDKVLDHPKVRLVQEDAKTFLQLAGQKYDAIISEPSNPWMAGVAGVFSLEYYATCRARLQPNGLMVQWVQVYETSDEAIQVVLQTFGTIFPHFSVWLTADADLALVGSIQPLTFDFDALKNRFELPSVKADFDSMKLFRLPVFLACEIISPDNAPFIVPPETPVHSDFYPKLETLAQRAFFMGGASSLPMNHDENNSTRPSNLLAYYLQDHTMTEEDLRAFALFKESASLPNDRLFRSILMRWTSDYPQTLTPIELSVKSNDRGIPEALEVQRLQAQRQLIFDQATRNPELLQYYAHYHMRAYTLSRSIYYQPPAADLEHALKRLIEVDPINQRVYRLQLAELAWDQLDDATFFQLAREGLDPSTNRFGPAKFDLDPAATHRILTRMIESMWRSGNASEAWAICLEARKRGYIKIGAEAPVPQLLVSYRKIESFINQNNQRPIPP